MMKKILYLFALLVSICSCVKVDNLNNLKDNFLTFSTVQSKATQTTWETGDKIGIFMVRQSAPGVWETIVDEAFNKCYVTNGDGLFAPFTPADAIKAPQDGGLVNFVAYYPYDVDLPVSLPCFWSLDMLQQSDLANSNFMVSRNLEGVKVDNTVLALDFKKPLSRIAINIRTQMDNSLLEGITVAIHGVKYDKADYALLNTTNDLANIVESEAPTMAQVSADGKLAEATLLCAPNGLSAGSRFVFSLKNGKKMTYTLPKEVNLESGVRYVYNIRLKDGDEPDFIDILPSTVLDVAIEGKEQVLSVLSEKSWRIISSPAWARCSPDSGGGGTTPEDVTITFGVNHNGEQRIGTIVFEQAAGKQVSVDVSQIGFTNPVPSASFVMDGGQGTVGDVTTFPSRGIVADRLNWTYSATWQLPVYLKMDPQSWISFSTKKDFISPNFNSNRVFFKIDNNVSSQPREVMLRLENHEQKPIKFFRLIQQGATDYLELSQSKFSSRGKGDTFTFVVTSRYDNWTIENTPTWMTVTRGTPSANKTTVTIVCNANQGAARSANLTIRSGVMNQTLEVAQNAKRVQTYPFNLSYSAIVHAFGAEGFRFVGASGGVGNYANTLYIAVHPGDGVSVEEVKAYGTYGFVVDPPRSTQFKSTPISGRTMVLSRYSGVQTTVPHIDVNINYNGWTYIRRADIYNMPVPAGLTDEDRLVYTIKMTEVETSSKFKYEVTYEIK